MVQTRIITPKVVEGFVSRQTNLGVDSYDLDELYSPDTDQWRSKVLDLGSPKYPPQVATSPTRYWFDRSRYNNHGAITGAIWTRLPSGLWYLDFDGTDDDIAVGIDKFDALYTIGEFTLMAWFKTTSTSWRIWFDVEGYWALGINGTANKAYFFVTGSSADRDDSTTSVNDGVWRLIAGVYDGTKQHILINGVDESNTARILGNLTGAGDNTRLGANFDKSEYVACSIALPRIFNTGLTEAQIAQIYQRERHLFGA